VNILIAPDSFKDALAAPLVCEHLRRGLHRTFPAAHYQLLALADGGEGTLLEADAVLANPRAFSGSVYSFRARGRDAKYCVSTPRTKTVHRP